ncbi:hypothetical protein [Gemmata sp.]|uniref:hypothetical protein n=1 Tax=Gemmata sp. TaxID=1914242 RepID=UPI003F72F8FF
MSEATIESLEKRIEALEQKFAERDAPKKDWRRSVGMFDGSEVMKQIDDEVAAMREAERRAVREGRSE